MTRRTSKFKQKAASSADGSRALDAGMYHCGLSYVNNAPGLGPRLRDQCQAAGVPLFFKQRASGLAANVWRSRIQCFSMASMEYLASYRAARYSGFTIGARMKTRRSGTARRYDKGRLAPRRPRMKQFPRNN